jgi:hypothetical protein
VRAYFGMNLHRADLAGKGGRFSTTKIKAVARVAVANDDNGVNEKPAAAKDLGKMPLLVARRFS